MSMEGESGGCKLQHGQNNGTKILKIKVPHFYVLILLLCIFPFIFNGKLLWKVK